MSAIEAAASLLAQARTGPALSGLPDALRPGSLDQAEAIQNATMQALSDRVGGWKVGRHAGQIFSAPIPSSRVMIDPGDGAIAMPSARFIELELGILWIISYINTKSSHITLGLWLDHRIKNRVCSIFKQKM